MKQDFNLLASFPPPRELHIEDQQLDHAAKEYIRDLNLNKAELKKAVLSNHARAIEIADPTTNTIGCCLVASILTDALRSKDSTAIEPAAVHQVLFNLLSRFDVLQVRYVGSLFRSILEEVCTGKFFSPLLTAELASAAISRLDPSGSVYTSAYLPVAKLALAEDCVEAVLPIIDRDLTFFPGAPTMRHGRLLCDAALPSPYYITKSTGLTDDVEPAHVLEYYYVSGLLYTTRRNWTKARKSFERAVTYPGKDHGVSRISLAAYKRWLLVGLLADGVAPTLPNYTLTWTKHSFPRLCTAYINLTESFLAGTSEPLTSTVSTNAATWEEDGTQSLVAEVVDAYQRWLIVKLRHVYSRLPISQIQQEITSALMSLNAGDVIALLESMIASGSLKAELRRGTGGEEDYLIFQEDRALLSEADFAREIAQSHHTITALTEEYKLVNERLSTNREYVSHMAREKKRAEKEKENPMGDFEENLEDDEDLMTGDMQIDNTD
ncbi:uncharacterized protein F5Z01DRAFT_287089 [Emericellopsis atlantica]|uniref:COP9 signalosome complex subunit 3 N-terminal helical repeats domain-containing protein n=1 Tax=Emericellopsis atlantica TaxID=2614577 RepID=A0A9P8CLP9_9HYPO|nr:uncharacterized protein F5Z01DRAFT_287089 [Emericellopsis atlantica]KAG9251235.1 hypothetical protein F5Z01DRAFT_287089 [Emericellopsis atlantica]